MTESRTQDPRAFIRQNLTLTPAPSIPEIVLYTAHPRSGLSRLPGGDNETPPYWAYRWAGGTVLARFLFDHPQSVAGRRIVDLGSGCGIVGIAAAKCGASRVMAVDVDPLAVIAAALNAEANGVPMETCCADSLDGPPPDADVVLAGDLFYDPVLAERTLPFLERCADAGLAVLIGDPGRKPLPRHRLELLASYPVGDFGEGPRAPDAVSGIFTLCEMP
jgi:predicted nicotinamide N-methyase